MKKGAIIISLGGSLIVPGDIDAKFLRSFKKLIEKHVRRGRRFAIICGGGGTARRYQTSARKIVQLTRKDVDWIGIHGTRLNAHLLRAIFYKIAHQRIIKNPLSPMSLHKPVLIAAGWRPGCSTDYDAVLLARRLRARTIINLTNIDFVYDKDPRKFKNAHPIKEISWRAFRAMLPSRWDPGLNAPFDPIASKLAHKLGLEVVIMNGRKLGNFERYLLGKRFVGTRII